MSLNQITAWFVNTFARIAKEKLLTVFSLIIPMDILISTMMRGLKIWLAEGVEKLQGCVFSLQCVKTNKNCDLYSKEGSGRLFVPFFAIVLQSVAFSGLLGSIRPKVDRTRSVGASRQNFKREVVRPPWNPIFCGAGWPVQIWLAAPNPLKSSGFRGFSLFLRKIGSQKFKSANSAKTVRPHPFLPLFEEGMRSKNAFKNLFSRTGKRCGHRLLQKDDYLYSCLSMSHFFGLFSIYCHISS